MESLLASLGPALISAGSKLFGGLLSSGSSSAANVANRQTAEEFANFGLEWRAADATRAQEQTGINRLALLGVPAAQLPAAAVGSDFMGNAVASSGQDLSRAAAASLSKQSRAEILNEELLQAKIDNVKADTVRMMATASNQAKAVQPGNPPGVPLPRPNPLTTDWDLHGAKPLTESYVDKDGNLVELPTQSASTATQNWWSLPSQIIPAGALVYQNYQHAMKQGGRFYGEMMNRAPDYVPYGKQLRDYYYRGYGY